jgi:dynactin 1
MPHLSDVRSSKSTLQLPTVLSFVDQTAASTVAKNMKSGASSWEAVAESIAQVIQEASQLLPQALETENITKSKLFVRSPSEASKHLF